MKEKMAVIFRKRQGPWAWCIRRRNGGGPTSAKKCRDTVIAATWSQLARQHATSNGTCWRASTLQQSHRRLSPVQSDFIIHSPRRHPVRLRRWLPDIYLFVLFTIDHERMLSCQVWKRSKISIVIRFPKINTAFLWRPLLK